MVPISTTLWDDLLEVLSSQTRWIEVIKEWAVCDIPKKNPKDSLTLIFSLSLSLSLLARHDHSHSSSRQTRLRF